MRARVRMRLRPRIINWLLIIALAAFWWGATAFVIHSLPPNSPL